MKAAVVVSCYNHRRFVKQCLESIKSQTYQDLELYFWDNNSTDGSPEIAANLLSPWSRGTYHFNTIRKYYGIRGVLPVGVARWLMVTYPTDCTHIAILDADDYWHPQKLEKQMTLFKKDPNVKLVFSDCYYDHFDELWVPVPEYPVMVQEKVYGKIAEGTFHDCHKPLMDDPFLGSLTRYNFMPCPTLVFEKAALLDVIGNPMHYSAAEDFDWILKMTAKYKCDYVPEPLAYYRVHSQQLTQKISARCTAEEIDAVKRAADFRQLTREQKRQVQRRLFWLYCRLIWKELRGG